MTDSTGRCSRNVGISCEGLMREVRVALEAGTFSAFVTQFHADRARGV